MCIRDRTTHLCRRAAREALTWPCLWFRAMVPPSLTTPSIEWIDDDAVQVFVSENITTLLNQILEVGLDGTGGSIQDPRFAIAASAAFIITEDHSQSEFLCSRCPGRHTVPRAELWAIICTMRRQISTASINFYDDASHAVDGVASQHPHYLKMYQR